MYELMLRYYYRIPCGPHIGPLKCLCRHIYDGHANDWRGHCQIGVATANGVLFAMALLKVTIVFAHSFAIMNYADILYGSVRDF